MITADRMSNAEYHATDAISSSDVKMVYGKSLAHWKAKVYKSSTVFDVGTAVHSMVLEDGKVIERGSHKELLAKQGAYHQLHSLQFNGADH